MHQQSRPTLRVVVPFLACAGLLCWPAMLLADHTLNPTSVTIPGSLQDELGCPGDWQPDCAATHLAFDGNDDVWQGVFTVPAGSWEYKAALNDSWDENYGANAIRDGANIPLSLGSDTNVKFFYDHKTHWVTDNVNSVIATAVGSFQSEIGCSGDWQPDCLRSWLQDPDGDGIYSFATMDIPAGSYEAKVAHDESWDENYGGGGVPNGPNIPFVVPAGAEMLFEYDPITHLLTITAGTGEPNSVTVAGSMQDELGCPGDWQPECAATHLAYDGNDGVWQNVFNVPAGNWEYKAALNDSWDENYGANAQPNGANIPLNLAGPTDVKFYYDDGTHWITENVNSIIAVVPGSFQSELGCPGDWQPDCLRSWLQDPDGDGLYGFVTNQLPAGDYEAKVAHDESWDENYGANGEPNGPNIPFSVPVDNLEIEFLYDPVSHVLFIGQFPVPVLRAHLTASGHHEGVRLEWTLNVTSGIDQVTLMRSVDGGPFVPVATWPGGDVSPVHAWIDRGIEATREYVYQLVVEIDGVRVASDPVRFVSGSEPPARSQLVAGVPNPFNARTSIHFVLAEPGEATLRIYDVAGREVFETTLTDRPAGEGIYQWRGIDLRGRPVASGTYVVRLETADAEDEIRVTLLK